MRHRLDFALAFLCAAACGDDDDAPVDAGAAFDASLAVDARAPDAPLSVADARAADAATVAVDARTADARVSDAGGGTTVSSLRYIGQQVLPRRSEFMGTVVGGLSGVDYNAAQNVYVLVSDDRTTTDSASAPRMYTARLTFDAQGFTAVELLSTFPMLQPGGQPYPKVPDPAVADPESVRIDPVNGNLVWVSEGDRSPTAVPPRYIQPFIREITPTGTHVREYTLPAMFTIAATDNGPRGNAVFEGLSFMPDGRLAVIMEGPRFEDGAAPTLSGGALSRLTIFDRAAGTAVAQYAYPIDIIQVTPDPPTGFTVNGPTEILALTNTRFLVLERSFSVGVVGNQVRLYEIDTGGATDVLSMTSLPVSGTVAVTKRLVLDFETLKVMTGGIANLEGMTFGPRLANGNDSLVIVADDNFPAADSQTDRNQLLVFEVLRSRG